MTNTFLILTSPLKTLPTFHSSNMLSKGINFQRLKHRANILSQNPKTTATCTWEARMSGLTLTLHYIDKAATV